MNLESNWISVKECLPDNNYNYLEHHIFLVFGIDNNIASYALAQWYEEGWRIVGETGVSSCFGEWLLEAEHVTHWMRLPDQPKL